MSKKKHNGKMKTCKIHDLLLDLCVKEAKCEKVVQQRYISQTSSIQSVPSFFLNFEREIMAYAALISLKQTLNQILLQPHSHYFMIMSCERHHVESLNKDVGFLQQFLESAHSSYKSNETMSHLETRIRDVVYEAQDMVDLHQINPHDVSMDYASSSIAPPLTDEQTEVRSQEKEEEMGDYIMKLKNGDLKAVIKEIKSIKEEIDLLIQKEEITRLHHKLQLDINDAQPSNPLRAKFGSDGKNSMVGFDDQLTQIKDQLTGESCSLLKVVPIVGMGGIGKTTLAINTYNDSYILEHFDIHAWVTVSQSYCIRNILLDLLDSMKKSTPELCQEIDDDELVCHIYKTLKGKRYLIVIDDIWDTDAWDCMRMVFPNDDDNGSRIIITTRITDVAAYASSSGPLHQMSPLKDDVSWNLLCTKVFGSQESCPFDLQEIGTNIALKCGGLPLAIVVIGGLLSKMDKTHEAWEGVAENINSLLSSSGDVCSEILKMSYQYLPQHLKACFLYMGVFPEDHEISISKLIKLWIAEGFLDQICNQSLEDVAERYLEELIDRSMLSVSKKKLNGKMKTCKIHDLLLDLCVKQAKCEKILQVTKTCSGVFLETSLMCQRRLSIHDQKIEERRRTIYSIELDPRASSALVRSFICIGDFYFDTGIFIVFNLLRVLDVIQIDFGEFPDEVLELVHLRYIALCCEDSIPAALSNLRNLQTLMIGSTRTAISLPNEIWKMTHLRHIKFIGNYVELRDDYNETWMMTLVRHIKFIGNYNVELGDDNSLVLNLLQTLSGIKNLRFTTNLIQRIPNIRKLELLYNNFSSELENIANLQQLKELKIMASVPRGKAHTLKFPQSLEKLTLVGCGIPWKDLSPIVGTLPHLQVLKLIFQACSGKEWEPNEGEFQELKVLLLKNLNLIHWNAEHHHFPALEHIIINSCTKLAEIPLGMGESPTLTTIQLWNRSSCKDTLLDSVYEIQENQKNLGNDDFRVEM